jgi:hypothetical protein
MCKHVMLRGLAMLISDVTAYVEDIFSFFGWSITPLPEFKATQTKSSELLS